MLNHCTSKITAHARITQPTTVNILEIVFNLQHIYFYSERLSADECLRHIWLEGGGNTQSAPSSPQEPNNNEKQRNGSGSPTNEGFTIQMFNISSSNCKLLPLKFKR